MHRVWEPTFSCCLMPLSGDIICIAKQIKQKYKVVINKTSLVAS